MSKIQSRGPIGRSPRILGCLAAAYVLTVPVGAFAQGMLCPVQFQVTSSEVLGALQITTDYASASALGDIVSCSFQQSGATDVLIDATGNTATLGYADATGFTGPAAFASCLFKTVASTAPLSGDFLVNIDDATDTDVPANDESPVVTATVGSCVPSGSCSYTPETGCKLPTVVGKSKLLFKDNADNTKDQAQFQ